MFDGIDILTQTVNVMYRRKDRENCHIMLRALQAPWKKLHAIYCSLDRWYMEQLLNGSSCILSEFSSKLLPVVSISAPLRRDLDFCPMVAGRRRTCLVNNRCWRQATVKSGHAWSRCARLPSPPTSHGRRSQPECSTARRGLLQCRSRRMTLCAGSLMNARPAGRRYKLTPLSLCYTVYSNAYDAVASPSLRCCDRSLSAPRCRRRFAFTFSHFDAGPAEWRPRLFYWLLTAQSVQHADPQLVRIIGDDDS